MDTLRVAGAQLNLRVGNIEGNVAAISTAMAWAEERSADVLLLPELAIPGYPPEDLLLRSSFIDENLAALSELAAKSEATTTVVGFVDRAPPGARRNDAAVPGVHQVADVTNAAAVLAGGEVVGVYHKVLLPNYGVFDEARYFVTGVEPAKLWRRQGVVLGVSVCEDIWSESGPPAQQAAAGAQILLNINGSPYHFGKGDERAALLAAEARRSGVPVVYLNLVGGQDELVFDGDSMVFDADGTTLYRAAQFGQELFVVDIPLPPERSVAGPGDRIVDIPTAEAGSRAELQHRPPAPRLEPEAEVYAALKMGLRDYVAKNGFREVVIGLSGGIDSALTCAIAVDALGPDAVWGVSMPARYSSEGSISDAADLAKRLGCRFDIIPIDEIFAAHLTALSPSFAGTEPGVAEENLQARIRGAVLMALSNKYGGMVVATGNKSEMAVGYATLYGDMAGGFSVLKDVFKTLVYRLALWRNRDQEVIPVAIVEKPPSAELRPDQLDSDSLPEYSLLDGVLQRYVEHDRSVAEIVAEGYPSEVVARVAAMVDRNEYKRRQAAPGVRITEKGFGKDRRLPITNLYRSAGRPAAHAGFTSPGDRD